MVPTVPQTYFTVQNNESVSISALLANPTPLTPTSPLTPTHPDFLLSNSNFNILHHANLAQLKNQLAHVNISSPDVSGTTSSTSHNMGYQNTPVTANINRFLHPCSYASTLRSHQYNNNISSNSSGYQSFSSSTTSLEHSFPSTPSGASSILAHVSPDTTTNTLYSNGVNDSRNISSVSSDTNNNVS